MPITPGNGFDFQYRSTNGISSDGNISGGAINAAPNNWVRLTRTNNTFYAFISADGVNWTTGCISVDNLNIVELYKLLPVGTVVIIKP